jgi:TRIAD3 protein (E3 ubiquitin-protein ligase RNF216)
MSRAGNSSSDPVVVIASQSENDSCDGNSVRSIPRGRKRPRPRSSSALAHAAHNNPNMFPVATVIDDDDDDDDDDDYHSVVCLNGNSPIPKRGRPPPSRLREIDVEGIGWDDDDDDDDDDEVEELEQTQEQKQQQQEQRAMPQRASGSLCEMFPDADPEHVATVVRDVLARGYNTMDSAVAVAADHLSKGEYKRRPAPNKKGKRRASSSSATAAADSSSSSSSSSAANQTTTPARDYLCTKTRPSPTYIAAALKQLYNDFPRYSVSVLRQTLYGRETNGRYVVAKRLLASECAKGTIPRLKTKRKATVVPVCPELMEEVKWEAANDASKQQQESEAKALALAEEEAERQGLLVDCGCCFGSFVFETMVQCEDGHMFCQECLKRFAQEQLFGLNRATLQCIDTGNDVGANASGSNSSSNSTSAGSSSATSGSTRCTATFPDENLKRVLGPQVMEKLLEARGRETAERLREQFGDNLLLFTCPDCGFAAALPDASVRVFVCPVRTCEAEACVGCREAPHIPLRCDEAKQKRIDDLAKDKERVIGEEKMTAGLVRTCPKCGVGIVKDDGCNKITCACGTLVCYVCREMIPKVVGYGHFKGQGPVARECPLYGGDE